MLASLAGNGHVALDQPAGHDEIFRIISVVSPKWSTLYLFPSFKFSHLCFHPPTSGNLVENELPLALAIQKPIHDFLDRFTFILMQALNAVYRSRNEDITHALTR